MFHSHWKRSKRRQEVASSSLAPSRDKVRLFWVAAKSTDSLGVADPLCREVFVHLPFVAFDPRFRLSDAGITIGDFDKFRKLGGKFRGQGVGA